MYQFRLTYVVISNFKILVGKVNMLDVPLRVYISPNVILGQGSLVLVFYLIWTCILASLGPAAPGSTLKSKADGLG